MRKRLSVSQIVQNYIRDYIVKNKLDHGDPLPSEGDIAVTLKVSRVSVREAVKVLKTLGILDVRHGNGLFVRGLNFDVLLDVLSYGFVFDPNSLKDLLHVRKLFESSMIPEVVRNIRQEDVRSCHEILAAWKDNISNGRPYHEQDRLFHVTLCESIGNKLLLELENIFWLAYRKAEDRSLAEESDHINMVGGLKVHIDLLDAVGSGDVDLAQQLMTMHFEGIRQRLNLVPAPKSPVPGYDALAPPGG